MRFQHTDGSWIVWVKRSEFPGATDSWPSEFTIGSIRYRSREYDGIAYASKAMLPDEIAEPGYFPYGLGERARSAWTKRTGADFAEVARRILVSSDTRTKLVAAKKKHRREEQRTGSVIVRATGERERRFHDTRAARDWAEFALNGRRRGARAEFYRATPVGSDRPAVGMPYTEPFMAFEVNDYGRVIMAGLHPSRFGGSK